MRLSAWRAKAPQRESMNARVIETVVPVLAALGAGDDPECWVAWGDDPGNRYTMFAPAPAGFVAPIGDQYVRSRHRGGAVWSMVVR